MEKKDMQIKINDEVLVGKYANVAQVSHGKEEFVLDFISLFPPQGILHSRIFVSPGHFKRMIGVMQENLTKYESVFGQVKESDEPSTDSLGFRVK